MGCDVDGEIKTKRTVFTEAGKAWELRTSREMSVSNDARATGAAN